MARRMMSERMLAIAPVVIAIASGGMIALLMPSTALTMAVFVITAAVVLWLILRDR